MQQNTATAALRGKSAAAQSKALPHDSELKKWTSMFVLSLALAIIVIDTTLLNVSFRTILQDLHTDIQHLQWVISAYSLMLAAFTITGGRLGDLFGRKKMFMLGAIIFAIGSFVASISTNFWMMLSGEAIIEGIGAALMLPATSSLLVSIFTGRERAIAFGIWGGIAAAASAVGPILGGFLTTNYSWRWGFRINVVVAVILLIGSVLVKESFDRDEAPRLDIVGVLLSAIGLVSIVFGIIESSTYGWWTALSPFVVANMTIIGGPLSVVPYSIALGIVFLILFLLWEYRMEKRGKTPLMSLRLFKNSQFSSGVTTMAVLSLSQAGIIFLVPIFLQAVLGLSAFDTGLALLPLSIALLIGAPLSSYLVRFVTAKRLIQTGLVLNAVAIFLLRNAISSTASQWDLAAGLACYGIGMGFIMAQISNLTLSAVSVQQAGEASGVNNTLRQVGTTLGSAVIGSIIVGYVATNVVAGIQKSPAIPDQIRAPIVRNIAAQSTNIEFESPTGESALPAGVQHEIKSITDDVIVAANKYALIYNIFFVLVGFLVSFSLPNVKNLERGQRAAAGH